RFFNPASVPMIANRKLLPSRPVKICTRNKIAFPLENHMAVFKTRASGLYQLPSKNTECGDN
ncbi:hypothetical protein, partial [Neorhodopirellula pilleata]|uniref:hypothetical protein n=1 Tax=Neorhodopirellula pilleata TaxID=2714738 RepID=UPI001E63DE9B